MLIPEDAQCFDAPAKLNLFLHITGRRDDGYHLLETVFQLVDLKDKIYLLPREDGKIVLRCPTLAENPEDDLTVRAASLLKEETQTGQGADIWYEKYIPVGAGLGGGSSDAATTLLALNHLWQTKIPRARLQQMALTLGADVPFFVFGQNAFASGVGEKLVKMDLPQKWYVIVYPEVVISTQRIFSSKDLTRNTPSSIMPSLSDGQCCKNDMQSVVVNEYPQVAKAVAALKPFGYPLMTGSGSCVFLACDTESEAQMVFQAVSDEFKAYCVAGLSQHVLYDL